VGEEQAFDADAFIVEEDAHVVVTRDGWIKRVRELKDPNQTRTREATPSPTCSRARRARRSSFHEQGHGVRHQDQRHQRDHRARRSGAEVLQVRRRRADRLRDDARSARDGAADDARDLEERFGLRFATAQHAEVTTKSGRRYARPKAGDEILGVLPCNDGDVVVCATQNGHVLHCKADEIAKLEGPGRGVTVIKTAENDAVIGFIAGGKGDVLVLQTRRPARTTRRRPIRRKSRRAAARADRSSRRRRSSPCPGR